MERRYIWNNKIDLSWHCVLDSNYLIFSRPIHLMSRSVTCTTRGLSVYSTQLDLPNYANEVDLKAKLLLAIREGSEGFGFA